MMKKVFMIMRHNSKNTNGHYEMTDFTENGVRFENPISYEECVGVSNSIEEAEHILNLELSISDKPIIEGNSAKHDHREAKEFYVKEAYIKQEVGIDEFSDNMLN